MDNSVDAAVISRQKFVEAWNKTMVDIWQERIQKLGIVNTGALYHSAIALKVRADGRFYDITLSQQFTEYGLWQDLGVGREVPHGNSGDVKSFDAAYREAHNLNVPRKRGPKWGGGYTSGNPREPRHWYSSAYYSSVMNLRDFMAESLGREFVGMFATLDAADQRANTGYYRSKGWA